MRLSSGSVGSKRARRKPAPAPQLDFWGGATGVGGRPDLMPTQVLLRHASCSRVLELIRQVRGFFPELEGLTVRVGLTRTAAGFASREEPCIWINPHRLLRHTIAHELTHLLQNLGHVPGGEKPADLFALARSAVLVDDLPAYLEVPRSLRATWNAAPESARKLLHHTACDAVRARAEGQRYYLQWFERELRERWEQIHETIDTPEAPAEQPSLFASTAPVVATD